MLKIIGEAEIPLVRASPKIKNYYRRKLAVIPNDSAVLNETPGQRQAFGEK
ncbi:hypothetical protein [Methylomonas albis]|nr:hypothetical protein [Methylomonas albis]